MTITYAPPAPRMEQPRTPERYEVPAITACYGVPAEDYDIPAAIAPAVLEKFKVDDPYIKMLDPERVRMIQEHERKADADARWRRQRGQWDRRPGTAYVDSNGNTREKRAWEWGNYDAYWDFFGDGENGLGDPGLVAWQKLVPRAEALSYLNDPLTIETIKLPNGQEVPATDLTREWLIACTDAVAIRNRGAGLGQLVREYVQKRSLDRPLRMLSVACGTALPTIQAARGAGAYNAQMLCVDKDKKALSYTKGYAAEMGIEPDGIKAEAMNIFSLKEMRELQERLMADGIDNRPDILDLMGILEYADEELLNGPIVHEDSPLLYDPPAFLRAAFDLVRPGGRLIFGQMRDDRPNADFTMGVVCWPYVKMLSPKKVMAMLVEAGIDPSWVTLRLTPEGVYTIGAIDKPLEADTQFEGRHSLERRQGMLARAWERARLPRMMVPRAVGACSCSDTVEQPQVA